MIIMLMRYTLFGHVRFLEKEDDIRMRSESMQDNEMHEASDVSGSCEVLEYYWIQFPGSFRAVKRKIYGII